jgi:hypothetical protein
MDRPTLAGHGSTYRRSHALSPTQARAWRAIVDCRTAALGGVRERCANCGAERHVWRSCRNRHCPQCQTRAKEAWRAARLREVLPVPYAHWVFTLPHALNPLAIRHPRWLYGALFDSAAATLLELAANPRWLGAVPGFSLVLHTWSQDLRMHLHVHALITCGGLDAEGRWRTPVRGPRFLFPVQAASKVFRGKFLARLDAAHRSGELPDDPHAAPGAWQARRRALLAHDWVVYAKPPPGGPAQVLDYLARYTHRVALSNDRLLGCEVGQVRLRVRDNETGGKRTVSLPTDSSSDASCATCCRPASSACATTGCSPAATSGPGLPPPVRRSRRRHHKRSRSKRPRTSSPASAGRIRDAARTVGSGVGTRSRSSWLAGTIRPRRRRAVGMGRHEHSRAPISILADAAFAPAGRGTFPDWRTRPTPPARRRVGTRLRPITAMAASAEPGAATR